VVGSEDGAIAALTEIMSYDRRTVRRRFEERFTATRMAGDYIRIYRQLLKMRTASSEEYASPRPDLDGCEQTAATFES
jgi:predicted chitinase